MAVAVDVFVFVGVLVGANVALGSDVKVGNCVSVGSGVEISAAIAVGPGVAIRVTVGAGAQSARNTIPIAASKQMCFISSCLVSPSDARTTDTKADKRIARATSVYPFSLSVGVLSPSLMRHASMPIPHSLSLAASTIFNIAFAVSPANRSSSTKPE